MAAFSVLFYIHFQVSKISDSWWFLVSSYLWWFCIKFHSVSTNLEFATVIFAWLTMNWCLTKSLSLMRPLQASPTMRPLLVRSPLWPQRLQPRPQQVKLLWQRSRHLSNFKTFTLFHQNNLNPLLRPQLEVATKNHFLGRPQLEIR